MSVYQPEINQVASAPALLQTLCYRKPNAQTVLLLHGGPGTPDSMPFIAEKLAARYQVIYFDQRGSGQSACENCTYTMPDYLSDMRAVLAHYNVGKAHIFGHSWGGLLAQLFAAGFPEQVHSLFLVSPGPGTGLQWRLMELEMLFYISWRANPLELPLLTFNVAMSQFGSDAGAQQLFRLFHQVAHKGYPAEGPSQQAVQVINAEPPKKTREQILKHPPLPDVLEVQFPVSIVFGNHDTDFFKMSRQPVIKRFPEAEVHEIPRAGHFAWMHNPDAFLPVLAQHFQLN